MYSLKDFSLFTDGAVWSAEGQYVDDRGLVIPAHGYWRICRSQSNSTLTSNDLQMDTSSLPSHAAWYVEANLRLVTAQGDLDALRGIISIDTSLDDSRDAMWEWPSPGVGTLSGRYTRIADTVISQGATDDGVYVLAECFLIAESGIVGLVRGVLSCDGETTASWALTLTLES